MKKLFLYLILLSPLYSMGRNYYIATQQDGGNNANPGTFASPWRDWYVITGRVVAGDSVFIRGGTYFTPWGGGQEIHCYWNNLGGTASNHVTIMNYPGEIPILSCTNIGLPTNPNPYGIYINNSPYLYVKGLTMAALLQNRTAPGFSRGWGIVNSNNVTIDQCVGSWIGGSGFQVFENSNNVTFLNCDSHHNSDPYSTGGAGAYGGSDGFDVTGGVNSTNTTFSGCRAWFNSDDGWDNFNTVGTRNYINCWAFNNGYVQDSLGTIRNGGDGNGFKLGPASNSGCGTDINTILRFLNNCAAFNNRLNGFDQNGQPTMLYQLYNCTSYKNGAWGYEFQYSCSTPNALAQTLKNNIAYLNTSGTLIFTGVQTNVTNNSWQPGYSVSAADFQSLDSAGVTGPRQSDGSLPYLPFLRLVAGSDLVNTGVNVSLPFCGVAPDLGAFELCTALAAVCGSNQTITLPVTTATISGTASGGQTPYSYTWRQLTGASSTITNTTSTTTSVTNLLTAGTYTYEFKVSDAVGATARDTITITVNAAAATAPTCSAGTTPVTITLPTNSVALTGTGASTAGNTVSYAWTQTAGSAVTINNANTATATAINLTAGSRTFRLTVTDNVNNLTCTSDKVVVTNAAVVPPRANAGADQIITLPINSVTLSGSATSGTAPYAYLWSKVSGGSATITIPSSASTLVTGLAEGIYLFELRVTDNIGSIGRDTMQVTVLPASNVPPTANAGTDQTITLPTSTIILSGSGTDIDGTIVSYLWKDIDASGGTITNTGAATSSVLNLLTPGVYKFSLTVTDNNGAQGKDTMQVTVNSAPIVPPTANAGSDKVITLPVNSAALNGSGSTTSGTIVGYLWTKLTGTGGSITSSTSPVTSATGLSQGTYTFELRVESSNGLFGRDTTMITVLPGAPTANAGPDQSITLPTSSVNLSGSAAGGVTPYAYLWTKVSGTGGTIVSATSANASVTGLTAGVYLFSLRVTGNNGLIGRDTMQVTVYNATPLIANAGPNKSIRYPMSSATLNGSASGGTPPYTYTWTKTFGGTGGNITSPNSATTNITGLQKGKYIFRLTVRDANLETDTDNVTVNVSRVTNFSIGDVIFINVP